MSTNEMNFLHCYEKKSFIGIESSICKSTSTLDIFWKNTWCTGEEEAYLE